MSEEKKDQQLVNAIKSALDDSVTSIDANTVSRLTQIRNRALERAEKKTNLWFVLPAGAIATACLALIVYSFVWNKEFDQPMTADDIELITSSDSLDLYEDLEFYEWLDDYELST